MVLVLTIGIVFSLNQTSDAASLLTESPPPSPIDPLSPLPDQTLALAQINPDQGRNDRVVQINLYGNGFQQESIVYLIPSAYQDSGRTGRHPMPTAALQLSSQFVSSQQLTAKVKPGIEPGFYDVGVMIDEQTPHTRLSTAYLALSADPHETDDLNAQSYHLWTSPYTVHAGEPVSIGLKIQRTGGVGGLPPFAVNFYRGKVDPDYLIGRGLVPGISPNGTASSSAISWTPQSGGEVTLLAVIDPDNVIQENNEQNNLVKRVISVRQVTTTDLTAPVALDLQINDGETEITNTNVDLTVDAEDPGEHSSGVSQAYYVELHWNSGLGDASGNWIPVQWTKWLQFDEQPHEWNLHPTPGLRYLQAWVADAAGNISARPASQRVSYIPETDTVSAGEIRVYRHTVAADQCLQVRIEPTAATMDPDLYVWSPSYTLGDPPAGYSLAAAGEIDEVVVSPTQAGTYQIEVEGITDATYRLQIESGDSCGSGRQATERPKSVTAKAPRTAPVIPVNEAPGDDVVAPESLREHLSFMPALFNRFTDNRHLSSQNQLFLPWLNRR